LTISDAVLYRTSAARLRSSALTIQDPTAINPLSCLNDNSNEIFSVTYAGGRDGILTVKKDNGTSVFSMDGATGRLTLPITGTLAGLKLGAAVILYENNGTNLVLDSPANYGIGTSTFGTSATNTLALFNGTSPTTSPIDTVQFFSLDVNGAGTASLGLRTEQAVEASTDTASHVIRVSINGTVYGILLTNAPP